MRKFTVQHGNGSETIECDSMESKDNRIIFKQGEHVVCDFNASYVHSVREVKAEKPDEKSAGNSASQSSEQKTDSNQPKEETKPA